MELGLDSRRFLQNRCGEGPMGMDNLPHGVGLLKDLRVVPFVQNLFRPIRLFPVIDEVVTQRCDVTVALYFRVQHFDSLNLDFARDRIEQLRHRI